MRILLVGGRSSLARELRPMLTDFAEVKTAGRDGCDLALDLAWSADRVVLPEGFDVVIHLAAHFGGRNFSSILEAEEINVLGALKLAHACKSAGVSYLMQISSIFAGLSDDSPFYNSYALSKRHGEELTQLYCRSEGLPLVVLRLAQIYGNGDIYRRHQPFLYELLDRAQNGQDIIINGSNDAIRNFMHVSDVIEIISRVVRLRIEGFYNCASQSNAHFSEIAAAAVTAFNSSSNIYFDPEKVDIRDNGFEANEELFRLIGYYPKITLLQGLSREAARRMDF